MRYLFSFLFLVTTLFAHGTSENHPHFFSTLHGEDFALVILGLVASITLYRYIRRETN
ncbi:MAG: hypothetical protein U9Q40_09880 [Campylobacterota bacterium]|nr:hypothetical protein [Campylobacterota bacterium]